MCAQIKFSGGTNMNFIAIIGIVDRFDKSTLDDNHTLRIKVEKSVFEHNDEE
jgi:hypothetical protein